MKKNHHLIICLFILLTMVGSANGEVYAPRIVFLAEPENFNPKFEVSTCYVMHEGKALFLKRCSTSTWSHTWGLPGGKIEENQTPLEAMLREVIEETGLDLSQEATIFLGKVYVRDPRKDFIYYMFKCEIHSMPQEIFLAEDEHLEHKWLMPKEALEELILVPGEDECINLIFP